MKVALHELHWEESDVIGPVWRAAKVTDHIFVYQSLAGNLFADKDNYLVCFIPTGREFRNCEAIQAQAVIYELLTWEVP